MNPKDESTPAIASQARGRPSMERPRVSRNLLIHGCAWVCVSALYCAYRVPLHSFIYPDSGNAGPVKLFTYYFGGDLISNLLMYAILAGTAYGLILLQKYREREVEAVLQAVDHAELAVLAVELSLSLRLRPRCLFHRSCQFLEKKVAGQPPDPARHFQFEQPRAEIGKGNSGLLQQAVEADLGIYGNAGEQR